LAVQGSCPQTLVLTLKLNQDPEYRLAAAAAGADGVVAKSNCYAEVPALLRETERHLAELTSNESGA